jgi:integral membrane protein
MLRTRVGRLRALGMLESVAMPLRYLVGLPVAVKIAGTLHGLLFLAFCIVLLETQQAQKWPMCLTSAVLIAALLPFGPFVIDRRLRNADKYPN